MRENYDVLLVKNLTPNSISEDKFKLQAGAYITQGAITSQLNE